MGCNNDDTSMRVLRLAREPSDESTAVVISGIVSTVQSRPIALHFTGRPHHGGVFAGLILSLTDQPSKPNAASLGIKVPYRIFQDSLGHFIFADGPQGFSARCRNCPFPCRESGDKVVKQHHPGNVDGLGVVKGPSIAVPSAHPDRRPRGPQPAGCGGPRRVQRWSQRALTAACGSR